MKTVAHGDGKDRPTPTQFDAFQSLYDKFNSRLFGGKLGPCMLNFSRKSRALGFFAPERWASTTAGGKPIHEISLNPSMLAFRSPRDTMSTLVHEMVHLWQQEHGTPPRRAYHDKEWAAKMIEVGLMPTDTGQAGGKLTGQHMTHLIIDDGPFAREFAKLSPRELLPFVAGERDALPKPRKPKDDPDGDGEGEGAAGDKSKTKFTCPSCSAKAWGKASLQIACIPCAAQMVPG